MTTDPTKASGLTDAERGELRTASYQRLTEWYGDTRGHNMEASDIAATLAPTVARIVADAVDRALAEREAELCQQVTENPREFLMRTLSKHQWEAVASALRVEVQSATAERDAGLRPVPSSFRVPTNRRSNPDGDHLNDGIDHVVVPVVIDASLALRGELQNTCGGQRIVLREWSEQVFLHELLHVALASVPLATAGDPHGHNVISRVEVALWETGWRLAEPTATAHAAHCPECAADDQRGNR